MKITSISCLKPIIWEAGNIAKKGQNNVFRAYKEDSSILTEMDKHLDTLLTQAILEKFPQANVISEENTREFDPNKPYTFTIDPIDGTDAFSQGMSGWCVAVGLLDSQFKPIASIVYAPQWGEGKFLFADILQPVTCNDIPLPIPCPISEISKVSQIMVSSYSHKTFNFHNFPGKVRNIGSGVLHLCSPALHCGIIASFLERAFIWDLVPGHAVAQAMGMEMQYWNNNNQSLKTYENLVNRTKSSDHVLVGLSSNLSKLRKYILEQHSNTF